jgi:alpha-beta hydrolase superfamily lysophospholipase
MVKDEDALMHLHHDPRRFHGYIMNKTAIEVIMMIKRTREETVKNFDVPFLALHGADDKVCLPAGAQMLLDKSATRKDRKRLETLPGMKHEFLHEGKVDGPKNIEKVVKYFDEQLRILEQSDALVTVPVPIK